MKKLKRYPSDTSLMVILTGIDLDQAEKLLKQLHRVFKTEMKINPVELLGKKMMVIERGHHVLPVDDVHIRFYNFPFFAPKTDIVVNFHFFMWRDNVPFLISKVNKVLRIKIMKWRDHY